MKRLTDNISGSDDFEIREPKQLGWPPMSPERIISRLQDLGFTIDKFMIKVDDYKRYRQISKYEIDFPEYYPSNLFEKSLEHYLAMKHLHFKSSDIFIDIASEGSPAPDIYKKLFGITAYRQDLSYPAGINGTEIGGDASHLPLSDHFVDKMSLHCSLEHFENNSDIAFIQEAHRVLKPGGIISILPLYLAEEYTIVTDPEVAISEKVQFENDTLIRCVSGWKNRHGRFYSPEMLKSRISGNLGGMNLQIMHIINSQQIHPSCYLTFAAIIQKPI